MPEISKALEDSNLCIAILTKENLSSPWLHYELGAISKKIEESRIFPILFDVEKVDVAPPLNNFQLENFGVDRFWKIVSEINNSLGHDRLTENQLSHAFEREWPNLESNIRELLANYDYDDGTESAGRTQEEILEELLSIARLSNRSFLAAGGIGDHVENELFHFYRDFNYLMHTAKQAATDIIRAKNQKERELVRGIRKILEKCSNQFTSINKDGECVASLMLRQKGDKFRTRFYSSNVPANRSENPSAEIHISKGYIGRAFEYRKPQIWNSVSDDEYFVPIRENAKLHYNSGITVPIFVLGDPVGILNIDSKSEYQFSDTDLELASAYGYTLGIVLVCGNEFLQRIIKFR